MNVVIGEFSWEDLQRLPWLKKLSDYSQLFDYNFVD